MSRCIEIKTKDMIVLDGKTVTYDIFIQTDENMTCSELHLGDEDKLRKIIIESAEIIKNS